MKLLTTLLFSLILTTMGLTGCAQPDAELHCALEYSTLGITIPFCLHAQCTGEGCLVVQPTCEGFTANLNASIQEGSFSSATTLSCDGDLTGSMTEIGVDTETLIDCYSIDDVGKTVCEGLE